MSPRVLYGALVGLLIARAAFGLAPGMWAWGLNAQRHLEPWVGWGLWLVMAAALIPAAARIARGPLARAADAVERHPRGAALLAGLGAGALVWALPDRLWFLGDFVLRQGAIEAGAMERMFRQSLPLDLFVHGTLPSWIAPGPGGLQAFARLLGALEAGLLAALALRLARVLGLTGAAGLACAAVVFFGGHLTVFTGFAKTAADLCLLTTCLFVFGLRVMRDGRDEVAFGLAAAAAFALHRAALMLLPAFLLVWGVWLRRHARSRARPAAWAALALPVVVLALMLPRVVDILGGFDLARHLRPPEVMERGAWGAALAAPRLLDVANLCFVLAPLFPLGLLALARPRARRWGAEATLLGALALGALPLWLFVHPQQGVVRDWDVFAPAAVPLTLFAAWAVGETLRAAPSRSWLAVAVVAAAAAATLQWLALAHDLEGGLRRVRAHLVEPPLRSERERALAWDFLGTRTFRLQRWDRAAEAFENAAELAPHRRILLLWGLSETLQGDDRGAERVYRQLLEKSPDDPLGWLGLAGAAARLGDERGLETALGRLRGYRPEGPEAREIRRHLRHYPQAWPFASSPLDTPAGKQERPARRPGVILQE